MKKIFLLIILLSTLTFPNSGGFMDLKWGSSHEETLKYMLDTQNLETSIISDERILYFLKSIQFSDMTLSQVSFHFTKNDKLYMWMGETYAIEGDRSYIKNLLKKRYDLIEERRGENDVLYRNSNNEVLSVTFLPDKIEFYFKDYNSN